MIESVFARGVTVWAVLAWLVSLAIFSWLSSYLWAAPLLALWVSSPVLWWWSWTLRRVPHRVSQRTSYSLGAVVAVAFCGSHALALYAVHISSTGGMAYFALPLALLLLTIAATWISDAASRREAPHQRPRPWSPQDEADAMARDLARRDAKRSRAR